MTLWRVSVQPLRVSPGARALMCSGTALLLTFAGFYLWDGPLTRFVHTLYPPVVSAPAPWLVQFSEIGDRLGNGGSLIFVSVVLLAGGYGLHRSSWAVAGWQSLLAHGLVGVSVQLLKHGIGRPRPKLLHVGGSEFVPMGGSGWDSFPSGHASATLAVATVLATHFPRVRWPLFIMAIVIAASRVFRGSHYLTDVAAGVALGYVVGVMVGYPWREWRVGVGQAVCRMTPFFVVTLAVVWTMASPSSDAWSRHLLVWGGVGLTLTGLVAYVLWATRAGGGATDWISGDTLRALVALGVAMTTGSLLVMTVVLLVCLAAWIEGVGHAHAFHGVCEGGWRGVVRRERVFVGAIVLALVARAVLQGLVPL